MVCQKIVDFKHKMRTRFTALTTWNAGIPGSWINGILVFYNTVLIFLHYYDINNKRQNHQDALF